MRGRFSEAAADAEFSRVWELFLPVGLLLT